MTHVQTCTHTHTYMEHIHTHIHACVHTHTCMQTYTHTHTHAWTYTHTHTISHVIHSLICFHVPSLSNPSTLLSCLINACCRYYLHFVLLQQRVVSGALFRLCDSWRLAIFYKLHCLCLKITCPEVVSWTSPQTGFWQQQKTRWLKSMRRYLRWSLCTVYLHACHLRVTVGNSGLHCCTCVTFYFLMLINSLVCWFG